VIKGLIITPALADLPSGTRGFHIHENPSCALLLKMENQALL
jgi:Cu-Zn family superoxide dismutase